MLDTVIFFVQSIAAAVTAVLGVELTFPHATDNPRRRLQIRVAFISLALITIGLGSWQQIRNARSAEQTNAAIAQTKATVAGMKEQVDQVYQLNATWKPRPTVEDRELFAKRAAKFNQQFVAKQDLKSELHLIAADIRKFTAERAANAPDMDSTYFGGPFIYDMVEWMNKPLNPKRMTNEEELEKVHRELEMMPAHFQDLTPNEMDSRWIEKNLPGIDYYFETRILFGKKFGKRIRDVVCGHQNDCGISKMELEACKPLIIDVRVAESRVYTSFKKFVATGKEPSDFCDLVVARNNAAHRIAFLYQLKKLPDPAKVSETPVIRRPLRIPDEYTSHERAGGRYGPPSRPDAVIYGSTSNTCSGSDGCRAFRFRLMLRHIPLIDAEQRVSEPLETHVLLGWLLGGLWL